MRSKLTAATLAAAIGTYVLNMLSDKLGVHIGADLHALAVAVLTALIVFVAGWLKGS